MTVEELKFALNKIASAQTRFQYTLFCRNLLESAL
jgi:hypothetical protein